MKQKGFVHILILVVVLGLAMVGYFILQNSNKNGLTNQIYQSQQESETKLTLIDGWNTYADNKYAFNVQLPGFFESPISFTWNSLIGSDFYTIGPSSSASSNQKVFEQANGNGGQLVQVVFEANYMNAEEWITESRFASTHKFIKQEESTQNENSVIRFTALSLGLTDYVDIDRVTGFVISNDDYSITLSMNHYPENQDYVDELMDQILSTFEFISQSNPETEGECLSQGGKWQAWGLGQYVYCQIPANDADHPCTDGSECSLGRCISEGGKEGKCQKYNHEFGCYQLVVNGNFEPRICYD